MPSKTMALLGLPALLCAHAADDPLRIDVNETRQSAETRQLEAVQPQTVLLRKDFEKRPDNKAGDLVKRMPGVIVSGAGTRSKDIRLRGLDKEYSRMEVDGIALPGGGEKREFTLDLVPSTMVEEVQFIRNPTADMEGDGIAGRVNIKTRPIPKEGFATLRGAWGEQDSEGRRAFETSGAWGKRWTNGFGILMGFSSERSTEQFIKTKTTASQVEREDSLERAWNKSLNVDLGYFGSQGELHLKPMVLREDNHKGKPKTVTKLSNGAITPTYETEEKITLTKGLQMEGRWLIAPAWTMEGRVAAFRTDEDKEKLALGWKSPGGVLSKSQDENERKYDWTKQVNADLTWTPGSHTIKAGVLWRDRDRERLKGIWNNLTNAAVIDSDASYYLEEAMVAGYIQDEWAITPTFTLIPGFRYESMSLESFAPTGAIAHNQTNDPLPRLHAVWRVHPSLTLRAAYSKVMTRPKFDQLGPWEIVKDDKVSIGNPNLKPTRAHAVDIGGEFSRSKVFVGLNLFNRRMKDILEEVNSGTLYSNGLPIYNNENVGDGWTRGIELEQRLDLGSHFKVWANQAYIESSVRDSTGITRPLKEQPRHIYNLGVDFTWNRLYVSLTGRHVGDRWEYSTSGVKTTEATNTLDGSVRLTLRKGLELFAEAKNITGTDRPSRENFTSGNTRTVETGDRCGRVGIQWRY